MDYQVRNGKLHTYGVEIQAAEHCNLRCAGCSQSSPFVPAAFPDIREVACCLEILSKVLHSERAVLLGGEPLLNPGLVELLDVVRASGVFDRVFITTNGILLADVDPRFWDLVDVVEISIYPSTRQLVVGSLEKLSESAWRSHTELHLLPTPNFRHITLTERIDDELMVKRLYDRCYFRHYCHTLYHGHLYKCATSTHIADYVARAGGQPPPTSDAVVQIEDTPDLRDRLLAFFQSEVPMQVCHFCIGSSGSEFPHRQMSASEIAVPIKVEFSADKLADFDASEI